MTEKNSKEDAGIDEGYGEPKEKVQSGWSGLEEAVLLPTSQRKKVCLFVAYTLPLHTGVIVSLCQSVLAALNLISMVYTSQEAPKHPEEMLAVDGVRRPCKTSRGLQPGPLGSHAVFLSCPYDKAWGFCMNGDCFNPPYMSTSIPICHEWSPEEEIHFYF